MTLPHILKSKLSREYAADGITVYVEIYRVRALIGWALEVSTPTRQTIPWEQIFATEEDAWQGFVEAVNRFTMPGLLTLSRVERARPH